MTALEIGQSAKVRDWLERERNITVMGGQDALKDKVLRIGHMGDVRDDDMLALFAALAEQLGQSFSDRELAAELAARPGPSFRDSLMQVLVPESYSPSALAQLAAAGHETTKDPARAEAALIRSRTRVDKHFLDTHPHVARGVYGHERL